MRSPRINFAFIYKLFGSGTDPISLLILLLFLLGWLFKKAQGSVISNQIGMKFGRIGLQVNMHRLMELDYWFDIILSKWWPRRHLCWKVLPPGECTCSVCRADMQQQRPA